MATVTVQANDRSYVFSPDDEAPRAAKHWMLVRARLVNDVTLRPVTEEIRVESDLPGTTPRISSDGVVGIVATPQKVFPVLSGRNYTVKLTFIARGFLSQTVSVVIPRVQKMTVLPLPARTEHILTLNDTVNLQAGELLMIGPGPLGEWEFVRITALGPAVNQVSIRPPLLRDHNNISEAVVAVIPVNFAPVDAGDVLMVPQP